MPTATSVWPRRQGRPRVSVITTATSCPSSSAMAARMRAADASGSSGSSTSTSPPALEASISALAPTSPCRVSAMTSAPRRATTRTVSAATASRWTRSRSAAPAGRGTTRPSVWATPLVLSPSTSPSARWRPAAWTASSSSRARSSPGRISGRPVSATTSRVLTWWTLPLWRRSARSLERVEGDLGQGGGVLDGVHQRRRHDRPQAHLADVPGLGGVDLVEHEGVGQAAVQAGDAAGGDLDAPGGEKLVRHAAHRGATDDRRDRHGLGGGVLDGGADPGHGQDGRDRHHRVGGAEDDAVRAGDGFEQSWRGPRPLDPREGDAQHRVTRLASHPVLLKAEVLGAVPALDLDPGLDRLVAHGQQADRHPQPAAQLGGGLAEGGAHGQQPGAQQVGGDVTVAEPEPRRLAQPLDRSEHIPGLTGQAPAALLVGKAGEGVGDRVQVWRDGQAVKAQVVTGIADDEELGGWVDADKAAQEPRRADAAGKRDEHGRVLFLMTRADRTGAGSSVAESQPRVAAGHREATGRPPPRRSVPATVPRRPRSRRGRPPGWWRAGGAPGRSARRSGRRAGCPGGR